MEEVYDVTDDDAPEPKKIPYLGILARFGIQDSALIFNNIPPDQVQKLKKILNDLEKVIDLLPEENDYAIINWGQAFLEDSDFEIVLSKTNSRLKKISEKSDKSMALVYLALNIFGLLLSVTAFTNSNLGFLTAPSTAAGASSGWNYYDALAGIPGAIYQIAQGEIRMGVINLASSLQLMGSTLIANIAKYAPALLYASNAVIAGLMGFSFAICMAVSCGIELCQASQCEQRIKKLEAKLETADEEDKNTIRKVILLEKAQHKNHLRSAESWALCTFAMVTVAIFSLGVSALTFGAALPIMVACLAVFSGLIRKFWVNQEDYVQNVKNSFKEESKGELKENQSLFDRCQAVMQEAKYNKRVVINNCRGFFKKELSFKDYLEEMLVKNPRKAEEIIRILEAKNYATLGNALKHETLGYKILKEQQLDSLEPSSHITDQPAHGNS